MRAASEATLTHAREVLRDALVAVRRDVRSADVIEVLDRALGST